jgi:hypothetical protein
MIVQNVRISGLFSASIAARLQVNHVSSINANLGKSAIHTMLWRNNMMCRLLLALLLLVSACGRKPDLIETLSLPDGFTLSMERINPRRPLLEFVARPDPARSTESVFLHHPSWKARESVPLIWSELKAGCHLYQSPTVIALTTKREIAWRVPGVQSSYWNLWQLDLDNLPKEQEEAFRSALYSLGHLPYEITEFDVGKRRCVLSLTDPEFKIPPRLVFQFQSTAFARSGANISGGTFVVEALPNK